jgi:glutaredoxin-related protein
MLCNHVWRFQPDIRQEIAERIQSLNLPEEYVGVHLRGGDKVTEAKVSPFYDYINYIKQISALKELFVFTDDYKNIIELKSSFPDYHIYTFCKEGETGFSEGAYNLLNKEAKKEITIKVLTDSEVLYKSSVFVGTMSSNVGLFIGMRRNAKLWYGIDANQWRMW